MRFYSLKYKIGYLKAITRIIMYKVFRLSVASATIHKVTKHRPPRRYLISNRNYRGYNYYWECQHINYLIQFCKGTL